MGGEVGLRVRRWIVLMPVKPHMLESEGNKSDSFLPQKPQVKYTFLYLQLKCVLSDLCLLSVYPCNYADVGESLLTARAVSMHTVHACMQIYTYMHTHLTVVSWDCVAQRWDVEWSRKCVSHEGMCLCWLQSPTTSQRENRHQHRSVCSPSLSPSPPTLNMIFSHLCFSKIVSLALGFFSLLPFFCFSSLSPQKSEVLIKEKSGWAYI